MSAQSKVFRVKSVAAEEKSEGNPELEPVDDSLYVCTHSGQEVSQTFFHHMFGTNADNHTSANIQVSLMISFDRPQFHN